MTIEEAGETILAGNAWQKCTECDSGYEPQSNRLWQFVKCAYCGGHFWAVKKRYYVACKMLGLKLPPHPAPTDLYLPQSMGFAVVSPDGSMEIIKSANDDS